MGLFGDFKKSLAESAGRIIFSQLADTQQKMAGLPEHIRTAALLGFAKKRKLLLEQLDNWTSDGRIEMGKTLQSKARETLNMNVAEGYALWLAGAWLESMERPGPDAAKAHDFLEEVGRSAS